MYKTKKEIILTLVGMTVFFYSISYLLKIFYHALLD